MPRSGAKFAEKRVRSNQRSACFESAWVGFVVNNKLSIGLVVVLLVGLIGFNYSLELRNIVYLYDDARSDRVIGLVRSGAWYERPHSSEQGGDYVVLSVSRGMIFGNIRINKKYGGAGQAYDSAKLDLIESDCFDESQIETIMHNFAGVIIQNDPSVEIHIDTDSCQVTAWGPYIDPIVLTTP